MVCSRREQHVRELSSLLQKLRDSWGADGSAVTVPTPLSNLLDLVKAAATTHQVPPHSLRNEDDADPSGNAGVAARQMLLLLDIARLALSSSSVGGGSGGGRGAGATTTPPKARSRALSLDCLRLGLLLQRLAPQVGAGEEGGVERDALAIAVVGARDGRWEVRVAAARAAGGAMRSWGRKATLGLLSSKQGCWLPAMLVDGYPEVEAAARAALSPGPVCDHGSDDEIEKTGLRQPKASIPSPSSAETPPSVVAAGEPAVASSAAVATMRGACEVLRAAAVGSATSSLGREDDGIAEPRFVDLAEEETMRTALRALRGGVLLSRWPSRVQESLAHSVSSPPMQQQQQQQQQQEEGGDTEEEARAARVEALELVEAWLAGTLTSPPDASIPWAEEEGEAQSAVASPAGAVPGGSLSLEARDAVRALLFERAQQGLFRGAALEAAAAVVEECGLECSRSAAGGGGREARKEREEREDDLWRRVYCGLLVRLEACLHTTASAGGRDMATPSLNYSAAAERSETSASGGGGTLVNAAAAAAAADLASFIPLTEMLAEALEEVPFAHEQAVPPCLDQQDNSMSVRENKALRAQGSRRRRWMVSSSHLLLRAGARVCERRRRSVASADAASGESDGERNAAMAKVRLLAAALPYQQATTRSDDPTEAWLSCVQGGEFLANSATAAAPSAADATAAAAATGLTTPIPWESCLRGQELPRHELPAPWAGNPTTVKLSTRLVDSAWSALSLEGGSGGPAAERNAEALVQALRAAVRARGGWRDEAGVGIKHAVSAAVRRLAFPLIAGATLGHALPLVLPLADDFDPAHQAVGFSLLLRLCAEASPAELGWHRGLLLEVLERGLRGGNRDPSASALCLAAAVRLLRSAPRREGTSDSSSSAGRAGIRVAREALRQAAKATDGVVRLVMVRGAAALLELPATGEGYAPCEFLRPALLCLLPILQSPPVSTRLDARAASLRAVRALCMSCWPRVHAHASKLLCALLWTCGDCARRTSVRKSCSSIGGSGGGDGGDGAAALPLGVVLAANHAAIDASTDEAVREHATRLGALVLLLAGHSDGGGGGGGGAGGGGDGSTTSSARATLREVCLAVSVLRPAGVAMEQLADRALLLEARGDRHEDGQGSTNDGADGGPGDEERGRKSLSSVVHGATTAPVP